MPSAARPTRCACRSATPAISPPTGWAFAATTRPAASRDLARLEGVFCEPASAAGVAGLRMLVEQGRATPDGRYVAVLTGHGLKDPGLAVEQFTLAKPVPADMDAIVQWLGW